LGSEIAPGRFDPKRGKAGWPSPFINQMASPRDNALAGDDAKGRRLASAWVCRSPEGTGCTGTLAEDGERRRNTGYFERLAVDTACECRLSTGAAAANFHASEQAIQPVGTPQQCTIGTAQDSWEPTSASGAHRCHVWGSRFAHPRAIRE